MLRANEFGLNSLVAAAFTADPSAFNSSKTLASLLGKFAERYNGEVQALPLPPEAPEELPRLVLQSRGSDWQLTASPSRINSVWKSTTAETGEFGDLVQGCAAPLETYIQEVGTHVGRLALIIHRRLGMSSPSEALIARFCNKEVTEKLFSGSGNFEIHNRKTYILPSSEWRINSWVRCKSATLVPSGEKVITIEQDINTLAEEVQIRQFTVEEVRRFFVYAGAEAQSILELYFPNE